MQHHELTGKWAIHPVAFVQADDPANDPTNYVTARKLWLDTNGNALKIRNETNTGWTTIVSGSAQVGGGFRLVDYVYDLTTPDGYSEIDWNDSDITYV